MGGMGVIHLSCSYVEYLTNLCQKLGAFNETYFEFKKGLIFFLIPQVVFQ